MAESASRMAAPVRDVTKGVIVSDKTTLIKDAHNTARELGGQLATFMETIGDLKALRRAAKGNYALAVDPKDMWWMRWEWYLLKRHTDKITFKSLYPIDAAMILRTGRLRSVLHNVPYNLLYVGYDITTKFFDGTYKEGSSIGLCIRRGGPYTSLVLPDHAKHLEASYYGPYDVARVTLSSQSVPQANAVPIELLRRAQEQLGKFKETARANATDAIEEVLRRIT